TRPRRRRSSGAICNISGHAPADLERSDQPLPQDTAHRPLTQDCSHEARIYRAAPTGAFASAVNTRGSASVMAIVCSKCAEHVPSTVTTVHRSGMVRVPDLPTFTIGSMAIVSPGCSLTPRLGLP